MRAKRGMELKSVNQKEKEISVLEEKVPPVHAKRGQVPPAHAKRVYLTLCQSVCE